VPPGTAQEHKSAEMAESGRGTALALGSGTVMTDLHVPATAPTGSSSSDRLPGIADPSSRSPAPDEQPLCPPGTGEEDAADLDQTLAQLSDIFPSVQPPMLASAQSATPPPAPARPTPVAPPERCPR